jgi:hypothetical protein
MPMPRTQRDDSPRSRVAGAGLPLRVGVANGAPAGLPARLYADWSRLAEVHTV